MGNSLVSLGLPPSQSSISSHLPMPAAASAASNSTNWQLWVGCFIFCVATNLAQLVIWNYKRAVPLPHVVLEKWKELQGLLNVEMPEHQREFLHENKLVKEAERAFQSSGRVYEANLVSNRKDRNKNCEWKETLAKLTLAVKYVDWIEQTASLTRSPSPGIRRRGLEATNPR
ncbi:hypothetical protein DFH07DRAFT_844573 [Mycena maculata]|uniref:Uncharacterized protein n=1 Tax=Mycena maculata TaxID=230809 RepID=A0AAD7MX89_9AGAR|nr:hypothetical protein DFH07DRAFT_844573 [Mycena maculata]